MKKFLLIPLLALSNLGIGQIFEGQEYEYTSEWIWGVNKNSNGGLIGGLILRHSRSRGDDNYETYGLEVSNVKHPSERREVGASGAGFTYGKSNYLYSIRMQYGRERILFKKANQQGVQISAGIALGPSIGLITPYYILTVEGNYEPYGPLSTDTNPPTYPSPQYIAGPGKLFQGLGESQAQFGLNAKASLSFEFGAFKSSVAGIEAGIAAEAFTEVIEIVPTQPNNSAFSSVFFTLFWGSRK